MPSNGAAVKVPPKRSKSKSRRRNKKHKGPKAPNPSPSPTPGDRALTSVSHSTQLANANLATKSQNEAGQSSASEPETGPGWDYPSNLCPGCYNTGMYSAPNTPNGPKFLHYCQCDYGTDQLAAALAVIRTS